MAREHVGHRRGERDPDCPGCQYRLYGYTITPTGGGRWQVTRPNGQLVPWDGDVTLDSRRVAVAVVMFDLKN